jgi:hypothetical protein
VVKTTFVPSARNASMKLVRTQDEQKHPDAPRRFALIARDVPFSRLYALSPNRFDGVRHVTYTYISSLQGDFSPV